MKWLHHPCCLHSLWLLFADPWSWMSDGTIYQRHTLYTWCHFTIFNLVRFAGCGAKGQCQNSKHVTVFCTPIPPNFNTPFPFVTYWHHSMCTKHASVQIHLTPHCLPHFYTLMPIPTKKYMTSNHLWITFWYIDINYLTYLALCWSHSQQMSLTHQQQDMHIIYCITIRYIALL